MNGGLEKFTEQVAVLAEIHPASYAVAQNTSYIDISGYERVVLVVHNGLIAATGTLDAKLQQAKDTGGTSVKDISGKAITQLADTADNKRMAIECKASDLDINNGFKCVRAVITPATAASLVEATLYGILPKQKPIDPPAAGGTSAWQEIIG